MMYNKSSELITDIHLLKQEIERLIQEQNEALRSAAFIGISAEEAKAQDERRRRISELTRQLRQMQQSG